MPYDIKNPNSDAPAEQITDAQYAELSAVGLLTGFDVTPSTAPAEKPAELRGYTNTSYTPATEPETEPAAPESDAH